MSICTQIWSNSLIRPSFCLFWQECRVRRYGLATQKENLLIEEFSVLETTWGLCPHKDVKSEHSKSVITIST